MDASPVRERVLARSGGRCEAMVALPRAWARCGRGPVDDHHALTRARGGGLLDELGETYHHLALCRTHHSQVDDHGYQSHLLIAGSAYRNGTRVVYVGPDEYLTAKYGPVALQGVRQDLRGAQPGTGLREEAS